MEGTTSIVDSSSVGELARFVPFDVLSTQLSAASAPTDAGRVVLIVRKATGGVRETPDRAWFTPEGGLVGDAWERQRRPAPEAQLAVMQFNVAQMIANGQPLTLFGDNLIVDLDLSAANLPPGSRLRAGNVRLEVTPEPHTGCSKFRARFGQGAVRFISNREQRHLNLRGIYMRVLDGGVIAVDDAITVISRGAETEVNP
jgi:MOSC domain-containing protein YiiM